MPSKRSPDSPAKAAQSPIDERKYGDLKGNGLRPADLLAQGYGTDSGKRLLSAEIEATPKTTKAEKY